ncbi:MAG TPA: hypothetical protein VJB60_03595 [Candidatus Peribacterales bacterium]|nr:hypothetical protein [Candidatus Peribacterales bacterium]
MGILLAPKSDSDERKKTHREKELVEGAESSLAQKRDTMIRDALENKGDPPLHELESQFDAQDSRLQSEQAEQNQKGKLGGIQSALRRVMSLVTSITRKSS